MMTSLFRIFFVCMAIAIGATIAQAEPAGPPPPVMVHGEPTLPTTSIPSARKGSDLLDLGEPLATSPAAFGLNPLEMLDDAGNSLARRSGSMPFQSSVSGPDPKSDAGLSSAVNILVLLTVISLAPSLMLMTTCFVRIIVVLGLLKQALGAQSIPPPQVVVALALFMTMLVMAPTMDRINTEAIQPYRAGEVTNHDELWARAREPLRDFMFGQIEATGNWSSLYMVLEYRGVDISAPENLTRADVDMISLIPAFMLSELKTAFLMGFKVYLPFLVIDMVISSLLISMSMMMLPPVLISLPFKLLLFVLVDGWQLVVGSLMSSFAQPVPGAVGAAVGLAPNALRGIFPSLA